jgi:hypothetical protein
LQKRRHKPSRNGCALASVQQASSGYLPGRFAAQILANCSNKEVKMELLADLLPAFGTLP